MSATGFHEGELATQRRAGVEADAKRLERMLDSAHLSAGAAKFLALQTFTAMTGRDRDGVLWISPLAAPAGFLQGEDNLLRVSTVPREADPLHRMPIGQQVGLVAIDFAARRRMRINGTLVGGDNAGLTVQIDQAYGNCPQYIHRREPNVAMLAATPAARRAALYAVRRDRSGTDRRVRHVLPWHEPSDPGQRRIPPGRSGRIRPGGLFPTAVVAGLPGQQHVQQLRQPRGR